jgi:drug/metabolite transporter (DMT)-like permease
MMLVLLEAIRPRGVKPNWMQVIALGVGFGGIALLINPADMGSGGPLNWGGVASLLTGAALWAVGSIYSRDADLPKSAMLFTGMEMLSGSIGLLFISLLLGEWSAFNLSAVSSHSLLGLLYLVTIGSLVGFVSYGWLLRNAPVSLVATYAYVNPLVAIFLGVWLAGEAFNLRILAAAVIIIGSVALINISRRSRRSQPVKPAAAD